MFLGSFYNERFTGEHVYLDQMDLWSKGTRVFGLASNVSGLNGDRHDPLVERFDGSLETASGALTFREFDCCSSQFVGNLQGTSLTGSYSNVVNSGDAGTPIHLERSADRIGTNPSQAPLTGYDAWRNWADRVIDDTQARGPYRQQELAECQRGGASSCLGLGNGLRGRKPEEAKRYWQQACDYGAWAGCKFLGDEARYESILMRLCSSNEPPSFQRNLACRELANTAEKAGKVAEAINWYQLGCNEAEQNYPRSNCARVEALRREVAR